MKLQSLLLALALVIPTAASADPPKNSDTSTKDKTVKKLGTDDIKIVAHLHHVNQMEIDLGTFAQKVATPAVKKYATMIVTDHTTADKALVSFGKLRGVAVIPADKADTEADKKAMTEMMNAVVALKKLKGADFDRAYLTMMVNGHDGEIAKTAGFIATSSDADLAATLESRKTTLLRHSDGAKELQRGGTQQTSSK